MRLLDKGNLQLDMTKLGFDHEAARRLPVGDQPALGHGARHGPDRLGQDDDALLGAHRAQQAERQHQHRRRSGRVQPARHQPGADARRDRPELRDGACARSCGRTRTSSWSARSATSRPRRSRSRRRSPATSCSRRCTPTTRRRRSRACSTWASSRSSSRRSVNLVLAQRLARKICVDCKQPHPRSSTQALRRHRLHAKSRSARRAGS